MALLDDLSSSLGGDDYWRQLAQNSALAMTQAQAQPQAPPVDRMMTNLGIVPGAGTDIQQAQAWQRQQDQAWMQYNGRPFADAANRLSLLGQAVTPYLLGAAPAGSVSSGVRLPPGGGEPPGGLLSEGGAADAAAADTAAASPSAAAAPSFITPAGLIDRMRRLVNRDPSAGAANNNARELEPGLFIGDGTHQQWLDRMEQVLSPDEIAEARNWYPSAVAAYKQHFGGDLGPDMMGAWLTGNVNASPSFAQLSALRTREQLINQTGLISPQKQGGLADANLRSYWQARGVGAPDPATSGPGGIPGIGHNGGPPLDDAAVNAPVTAGGQKIYDFIDSANGSPTRTFYGNDPAAGAPFVADVHSLRDMGFIDGPLMKWASDTYGPEAVAGLKKDAVGGGPSETQYEWAANKGRDLTDWLNQQGYMGGNWTPAEVQAVGWKTMSKMMGRAGETPEQAITANRRPMSYELDPGQGSPFESWFKDLGWQNLSSEDQAAVTRNVMGPIIDFAKQQTGALESSRLTDAYGGWNNAGQATLAPSGRSYIVSSPEVFGDMADIVGHLANQTKIFGMRPVNSGGRLAVNIFHPDLADPDMVQGMWDGLVQNHPDFAAGFSPAQHPDGTPGMEMMFDKGGVGMANRIQSELLPGIDRIADNLGMSTDNLRAKAFNAEDLSRENDWTQGTAPQGTNTPGTVGAYGTLGASDYLRRLSTRYGPDLFDRMANFADQTLHPLISNEIRSRQPQAAAGAGINYTYTPPPRGLLSQ